MLSLNLNYTCMHAFSMYTIVYLCRYRYDLVHLSRLKYTSIPTYFICNQQNRFQEISEILWQSNIPIGPNKVYQILLVDYLHILFANWPYDSFEHFLLYLIAEN